MKWILIGFIQLWRRVISPMYGDVCKYYPSCSAYGLEAVRVHGAVRGVLLTTRRLLRCHPWAEGGFDPVPGSQLAEAMAADPEWFRHEENSEAVECEPECTPRLTCADETSHA